MMTCRATPHAFQQCRLLLLTQQHTGSGINLSFTVCRSTAPAHIW